jgi:hypothetical protein
MTTNEIVSRIQFCENRLFGLKIMINSHYNVVDTKSMINSRSNLKQEILELKRILGEEIERKKNIEKLKKERINKINNINRNE